MKMMKIEEMRMRMMKWNENENDENENEDDEIMKWGWEWEWEWEWWEWEWRWWNNEMRVKMMEIEGMRVRMMRELLWKRWEEMNERVVVRGMR